MRRSRRRCPPVTGAGSGTWRSPPWALIPGSRTSWWRSRAADRDRLGFAAAATALERASELTPDPDLARQRLALAAHDAFQAGDVARVRGLVDRVLAEGVADRSRGEALFTLGMLEQYAGSVPQSVEYLDEASYLLDGSALVRDLTELALARFRLNDISGTGGLQSSDRHRRRSRRCRAAADGRLHRWRSTPAVG